jgi:hypothetical protein
MAWYLIKQRDNCNIFTLQILYFCYVFKYHQSRPPLSLRQRALLFYKLVNFLLVSHKEAVTFDPWWQKWSQYNIFGNKDRWEARRRDKKIFHATSIWQNFSTARIVCCYPFHYLSLYKWLAPDAGGFYCYASGPNIKPVHTRTTCLLTRQCSFAVTLMISNYPDNDTYMDASSN